MARDFPHLLDAKARHCKICDTEAAIYGAVDFSKTHSKTSTQENTGHMVIYNKCPSCGTLFSCSFDTWSDEQMSQYMCNHNSQDHTSSLDRAHAFHTLFQGGNEEDVAKKTVSILNYGGGDVSVERYIAELGYANMNTFSHNYQKGAIEPDLRFDIVTAFDVLERSRSPLGIIDSITRNIKCGGLLFFSTLTIPDDFNDYGLSWWYVAPRIGRVTIFTNESLQVAFAMHGYVVKSLSPYYHIAYKGTPAVARYMSPLFARVLCSM